MTRKPMVGSIPGKAGIQPWLVPFFRTNIARQRGFTYMAVLFFIAASGAALGATASIWSFERQREKEQELLWVGNKFREAIGQYYERTPGTVKRYPEKLEDLLEDRRYLTRQRYLRAIYRDPITGDAQWGLVRAPDGGIMGVHSMSEKTPAKTAEFFEANATFADAKRYADWRFVYERAMSVIQTPAAESSTR